MNVVFISPHFPLYFYNFCERLKERGVNVLGIGDAAYNEISDNTKNSLTEYYKVTNLEDYDEVYRACAYYTWKYGKIDWIESQNEYWLELEATLRNEFNVTTGTKIQDMGCMKYKSKMKAVYESVNVPVARYRLVDDYQATLAFANKVGYPVIVKPDNGVGASSTYKLKSDAELDYFFATKNPHVKFIIEELVPGHVETFDGITDSNKNILIATSHVMLNSIMDNVNEASDTAFYSQPVEGLDLYEIGEKVVKAFDTRSRYFHFEFFRLDEDKEGLGKKGDIIGLEVNHRTPGGYTPDMMNFANDVDIYQIYADMVTQGYSDYSKDRPYHCVYCGRRDGLNYTHTHEEVVNKYGFDLVMCERMPDILAGAMGNFIYTARFKTMDEVNEYVDYVLG